MEQLSIGDSDISFSDAETSEDFVYCILQCSDDADDSAMRRVFAGYLHIKTNHLSMPTLGDLSFKSTRPTKYAIIHKYTHTEPGRSVCEVEFLDINSHNELPLIKSRKSYHENGQFCIKITY
jgi:hypothetical protein